MDRNGKFEIVPQKYWIQTKWASKSLILATLKMFAYAYKKLKDDNKANERNYYCLVDKTTYPIHNSLRKIQTNLGKLCNGNQNIQKWSQWVMISEKFLKKFLILVVQCVIQL